MDPFVQPIGADPKGRRNSVIQMLLAFLPSLGVVFLVFWGGWSLGFCLAVILTEIAFTGWLALPPPIAAPKGGGPPSSRKGASLPIQILLAIAIVDLALCFFLYDNVLIRVANFLVLVVLIPVQYLLAARAYAQNWDEPDFWLETALSILIRPWLCLKPFSRSLAMIFSRRRLAAGQAKPARSPFCRVLAGIGLALPVLLVTGVLLASADAVFAELFRKASRFLIHLDLDQLPWQLLVAALLLPLVFSFLYSGRRQMKLLDVLSGGRPLHLPLEKIRFDKLVLNAFFTCINVFYLIFAVIQLAYLTGAFQAVLPENLTYAQYARSGFFELAAVSTFNLALVLLAVKAADRQGKAGTVLRVESLLLIVCSFAQWASAIFRMKMYIDAYGLTLIRFLASAFMCLQFLLFILMLIKELRPRFPLFRTAALAALLALLALNHINSDIWITRWNVQRYEVTGQIDTDYFQELSASAVPAMLQLVGEDSAVAGKIALQLSERYDQHLRDYAVGRWQRLNIAREVATRQITERLSEIRTLAGESAGKP